MLRNLDQYKISNPYKAHKSLQCIPDELSEQLKKVDFLSSTTISMLKLQKQHSKGLEYQSIFSKMTEAIRVQQEKYRQLFELKEEEVKENLEMLDCDSISEDLQKKCLPEEVITTREQISLDFEPINNNFFYKDQEDELSLLQSNLEENHQQTYSHKEHEIAIMDVQYEHYFVN